MAATSTSDLIPEELLPSGAKALIFDCDGTLVDSMDYHFQAWKAACDHFGLHLTMHILVELAGKPVNELFQIITQRSGKEGQVDMEDFFAVRDAHYKKDDRPAKLIEPVMVLVRAGQARGLPMAIASGGTTHHVHKSLTETGIIEMFQAIVCGEDVSKGKPAPDAFLLAASKLGVDPSLCVGYEDAKLGLEAIKAAGYMAGVDVTLLDGYPRFV